MTVRVALTPGEPAGIGPDLTVRLAQQNWPVELVAIADPELLQARAELLGLPLTLTTYDVNRPPAAQQAGTLTVLPVKTPAAVKPGQLDLSNASYVVDTLTRAGEGCLHGEFAAVVTAPVHKGIINDAGISFSGHTEFFAAQAKVDKVVMMLASPELRVALVTTHLPLRDVADAITPDTLEQVITILVSDMRSKFGLADPRILVCGLNPHAGEQGHLGSEENDVIIPVLDKLRNQGFKLHGPLPADTLFQPHYLDKADAVLAMYHDQGLPVLKYQGFGTAMNITLGLPYIRTSVDHGTALSLAGTNEVSIGSAQYALEQAISLANQAAATNR